MHIACASDENYAPFAAVMLHSLRVHTPEPQIHVHFLCPPEFSAETRNRLHSLAREHRLTLDFHEISNEKVTGLPAMRGIHRIVWYRLFLDELLPDLDRILYLDTDTLIADDLSPLWETDLGKHQLAAVQNVTERALQPHLEALGLPPSAPFFNTGVLLLDLAEFRRKDSRARVLAFAHNPPTRLRWGDQDAFNAVLWSECLFLHPRWNCQNSLFVWPEAREVFGDTVVDEAINRPAILHFEGPDLVKPWHYLSEHPFRLQYWTHMRQTPWSDLPVQGRTLKNMAIRYLPRGILTVLQRLRRVAHR